MDKIRLLAICYEDPEVLIGGRGTYIKEVYRAMAPLRKVDIDLLTIGPSESKLYFGFRKWTADKLVCWKPQEANLLSNFTNDIQMLRTLLRWAADGKRWDIVHIHDWDTVQIGRAARDAFEIPLVGSVHLCMSSFVVDDPMTGKPLPIETLYCMQQEGHLVVDSDETVTCSFEYARLLNNIFMTDRNIHAVHNGIRTDEWYPGAGNGERAKRKFGLSTERPIALFVGRIAEMKGIRQIIQAVESADNDYQIVICGEVNANTEEQRNKWDVTVRLKDLEARVPHRLKWIGFHRDQDLKDIYAAADVGLMPSTHEPFGIVALEFMAMGVPLIASEVGGLGEVVIDEKRNEYALIIEPSGPNINAALAILRNSGTKNELRSLGLKRAKAFTWKTAAEKTIRIYMEALSK